MSEIKVDTVGPRVDSGTLTIGAAGDTVNIAGTAGTGFPTPTTGIAASAITTGTMATARLGSGTASSSTFLRGDQTYAAVGSNTPAFSVAKSAAQTITNNTTTKITFNTEYLDTDNAFASDKFTCPVGKAGQYSMTMKLLFWKNSGNYLKNHQIDPYLNGSSLNSGNMNTSFIADSTTITQMNMITSFIVTLAEGNYVECYAKALTVDGGNPAIYNYYTNWSGFKLI